MEDNNYKPIADYGVIGNLRTAALVGMDGSIDWCCMPDFDSPSVFGALLDAQKGGCFRIYPLTDGVPKQMYYPDTNVLLTRFLCADSVGEITDFMPVQARDAPEQGTEIVREVKAIRGGMRFRLHCQPAFDYARGQHELEILEGGAVFKHGDLRLGLSTSVPLRGEDGNLACEFELAEGDSTSFLLRLTKAAGSVSPIVSDYDSTADRLATLDYWRRWASGIKYTGRWREEMMRSGLALKLLTYDPTGAIVAAPTTSLPEQMGGGRNWDYRYSWIRDAAFTVYAFVRLGLTEEAERFTNWVADRAHERSSDRSLQALYSVRGEHALPEHELSHLEGYRGSAPVRIGNAAAKQLQLDIYGELMDAVYLSNKYGKPISYDLWQELRELLGYVMDNWQRKDEGIWEIRGRKQHMVNSKLMCWVALDRGSRLADKRSFPGHRQEWRRTRDLIYEEIMDRGWSERRKSFVQHYDTDALDASNLLMPLTFFMSPSDPRMIATLDATMANLVSDGLVYRYDTRTADFDGIDGDEGAFNMCTFWLVEALTRAGRIPEARLILEKMLTYSNHLGLYSEQTTTAGALAGNFPQAFTHMGLISAAFNLDRTLKD